MESSACIFNMHYEIPQMSKHLNGKKVQSVPLLMTREGAMNFRFLQSRHNSEVYESIPFQDFEKDEKCGIFVVSFVVFGWIVILTIGVIALFISGKNK